MAFFLRPLLWFGCIRCGGSYKGSRFLGVTIRYIFKEKDVIILMFEVV
jgi:hypothetical protein